MKAIFAAFAVALLAGSATAAPSRQSMSVKTGDLNLSSEQGQKILALRIHRAATAMCESEAMKQLPQNKRAERQCIADAKASAMAALQRKTGMRSASR